MLSKTRRAKLLANLGVRPRRSAVLANPARGAGALRRTKQRESNGWTYSAMTREISGNRGDDHRRAICSREERRAAGLPRDHVKTRYEVKVQQGLRRRGRGDASSAPTDVISRQVPSSRATARSASGCAALRGLKERVWVTEIDRLRRSAAMAGYRVVKMDDAGAMLHLRIREGKYQVSHETCSMKTMPSSQIGHFDNEIDWPRSSIQVENINRSRHIIFRTARLLLPRPV